MEKKTSLKAVANIVSFYWHGFRSMQTGRTLWFIIVIKLIIIFGFLKVIFFPDLLDSRFDTDAQRAAYVLDNITKFPDNENAGKGI